MVGEGRPSTFCFGFHCRADVRKKGKLVDGRPSPTMTASVKELDQAAAEQADSIAD